MDKEVVLSNYIALRSLDCGHPDTIKNYERYIRRFLDDIKSFDKYNELGLVKYEQKISKQFSQTTLNLINPLLKNFIKWKYQDYSLRFPMLDKILRTKKPMATHDATEMLSLEEIMNIIKEEDDLFWKTFWLVYSYGGFRPIDTARLKWDSFSWEDDGSIIVKALIGKNKKKFYKHIPANVVPIIKRWKEVNPSDWVFPSPKLKGQHINSKTPANRMSRIAKKILGREVTPYVIRHSISTILYGKDDLPDDITADQMGHHKSMKEIYEHMNDEALTKRAKRVWTDKEEMPEEEKNKLQTEIKDLRDKLEPFLEERNKEKEMFDKLKDELTAEFIKKMKDLYSKTH